MRILTGKPGSCGRPPAAFVRARDVGHALFRPNRCEIAAERFDVVVNLRASFLCLRRDSAIDPALGREIHEVVVRVEAASKVEPRADDVFRWDHQGPEERELGMRPALDGRVQRDLGVRLCSERRLGHGGKKDRAQQERPEIPSTSTIHGVHPGKKKFSGFTE